MPIYCDMVIYPLCDPWLVAGGGGEPMKIWYQTATNRRNSGCKKLNNARKGIRSLWGTLEVKKKKSTTDAPNMFAGEYLIAQFYILLLTKAHEIANLQQYVKNKTWASPKLYYSGSLFCSKCHFTCAVKWQQQMQTKQALVLKMCLMFSLAKIHFLLGHFLVPLLLN